MCFKKIIASESPYLLQLIDNIKNEPATFHTPLALIKSEYGGFRASAEGYKNIMSNVLVPKTVKVLLNKDIRFGGRNR